LIVYVQCGGALTPAAIELIVECLESKRKMSRCGPRVRDAEQALIVRRYWDLLWEGQTKIAEHIAHERKLSRRHVFEVIAAAGERVPRYNPALFKKWRVALVKGDIAADKLLDKLILAKLAKTNRGKRASR
jgi:hypothetical protein